MKARPKPAHLAMGWLDSEPHRAQGRGQSVPRLLEETGWESGFVYYSALMLGRIKVSPEKGLWIGPNGVQWLVRAEAEADPRTYPSSICSLQLICHGLAQGKMKSLWLKVKKWSKHIHCARQGLFASHPFLGLPLSCFSGRLTPACRLLAPGPCASCLLPGCGNWQSLVRPWQGDQG